MFRNMGCCFDDHGFSVHGFRHIFFLESRKKKIDILRFLYLVNEFTNAVQKLLWSVIAQDVHVNSLSSASQKSFSILSLVDAVSNTGKD